MPSWSQRGGSSASIILHFALDLAARVLQHFGGDRRPGSGGYARPVAPLPNNHYDQREADGKRDGWKRVGEPIVAARRRGRQGILAIFLHERLQDRAV